MIKAVIFDMDGLLINSEPLWKETEVQLFNGLGVPITYEMTDQTMGMTTPEAVAYWYQRYLWDGRTQESVGRELDAGVLELIKAKGQPMPGVDHIIGLCEELGLPMAVASSSPINMINAVIAKLGIGHHLKGIHSALFEQYGKPHPAVYISAAEKLGVTPGQCLAFEDSPNGVLSAKAAKMRCVAVPEAGTQTDKRFGIADIVVDSLADVTREMMTSL